MRVLVVEDDTELAEYLCSTLKDESFFVQVCYDGASALQHATKATFDIILLDVMLPGMNGLEVTLCLRRMKIATPILLLTARDAPEDVVEGLDAGADDYLAKPFSIGVLLARVRARTRLSENKERREAQVLTFADLTMDPRQHEVTRSGIALRLTRTEFALLECLLRAHGRIVPRTSLLDMVWPDREVSYNNLETFMRLLRSKVDLPGMVRLIYTDRGVGYRLCGH